MTNENSLMMLAYHDGERRFYLERMAGENVPQTLNAESGFHIYHVRMLTELILRELAARNPEYALSEEDIQAVAIASSLHDIGKLRIPRSILDYPGRLSPVEYDIMKKHSTFGEELIKEIAQNQTDLDDRIIEYAAVIARAHHERIDGTGYPDGLRGKDVPLCAQVVALADVYDALTSQRAYKDAFSQDVAVQMISDGKCGVFDEALVDVLMQVVNHRSVVALRERIAQSRNVLPVESGIEARKVLCIGNTAYLTPEFIRNTFPGSKVTVIGTADLEGTGNIKLFKIRKPSIKAIFETYEFDLLVFFSGELTFRAKNRSDSEELREVLHYASVMQPKVKILYLSSLHSAYQQKNDKSILSQANEKLCEFYAAEKKLDIRIVQIPFLYSGIYRNDFLHRIFVKISDGKPVQLGAAATDPICFISLDDLSLLITRMMDYWKSGGGTLMVGDEFGLTFADFAQELRRLKDDVKIEFTKEASEQRISASNKSLRREYGWFARISILEDLADEYNRYLASSQKKIMSRLERIKEWLSRHPALIKLFELFAMLFVSEALLRMTDAAVVFSIVDFRVIYIVIIATVHGLQYGLSAAALSSLAWLYAKMASGTNAFTIFYEPTNWMPFVFYFLVGSICGYVKLHKDDTIRSLQDEKKLLEDKLTFTRELYEDTFQEKRELRKQIIGSKDSFGKIFDVTRKLDAVEPQALYLKIIEIFEDLLENKSVTVYSVTDNSAFGRLEVASREMLTSVSRSISTEMYAEIISKLHDGEIWRNTALAPQMPMYAAGVYRDGKLIMLIFLWRAGMDQRSLYYVNLFRILRDLVQMSLLRAFDYSMAVYDKQFISGTRIMNTDAFEKVLANFTALAEKKVSSFVLLEMDPGNSGLKEIEARLLKNIRANDVMGITDEGKLRIILSQASKDDLEFILPRFINAGLDVSVLN